MPGIQPEVKISGTALKEIAGSDCHGAPLAPGPSVLAPDARGVFTPFHCSECGQPCARVVTGTEEVTFHG